MLNRPILALSLACLTATITGCVGLGTKLTTVEMAKSIYYLREHQVLRNLADAVGDHNFVPSEIVLGTGTAGFMAVASPVFKLPNLDFSSSTRELDTTATDTWSGSWQMTPVTDSTDLRN